MCVHCEAHCIQRVDPDWLKAFDLGKIFIRSFLSYRHSQSAGGESPNVSGEDMKRKVFKAMTSGSKQPFNKIFGGKKSS